MNTIHCFFARWFVDKTSYALMQSRLRISVFAQSIVENVRARLNANLKYSFVKREPNSLVMQQLSILLPLVKRMMCHLLWFILVHNHYRLVAGVMLHRLHVGLCWRRNKNNSIWLYIVIKVCPWAPQLPSAASKYNNPFLEDIFDTLNVLVSSCFHGMSVLRFCTSLPVYELIRSGIATVLSNTNAGSEFLP